MSKEKFTSEQLTCIIKNVCTRHGFDRLGFKVFDGRFVVSFPSETAIGSDLILELSRTLGLSLQVSVGWHRINLSFPL